MRRRVVLGTAASVLLSLSVALAGCGGDVTEIVLEVHSDLDVPGELDAIVIDATGPEGQMASPRAELGADEPPLPRTATFVHGGGALGPVTFLVRGMKDGTEVVRRELRMDFERGASLRVVVELSRACLDVECRAGRTCAEGRCRDVALRPCEVQGRTCEDAGIPDAGPMDAGDGGTDAGSDAGDAGGDAGPGCPLDDGICGVAARHLPGDRLQLSACAGAGGASLEWTLEAPSDTTGPTAGESLDVTVVEAGEHTVTAVAADREGCEAAATFEGVAFEAVPTAPAAVDGLRDLAARPGAAFLASQSGPWAATASAWHDLDDGAAGDALPTADLQAVAVLRGEPIFGATNDQDFVTRVDVDPAFASVSFENVMIPSGGDRSVRSIATPAGGDPGEVGADVAPVAVGTKDSVVALEEDVAGNLIYASLTPDWEASADIAVGTREPDGRGAIWGLKSDKLANFDVGGAGAVDDSNELGLDVSDARAVAVDDRDGSRQRLWLCSADADVGGIVVYDLARDWSTVDGALPSPPLGEARLVCRDVAVGQEGDGWLGTAAGLQRFAPDGARVLVVDDAQGLPAATGVELVATAWDDGTREVWLLTDDAELYFASADPLP